VQAANEIVMRHLPVISFLDQSIGIDVLGQSIGIDGGQSIGIDGTKTYQLTFFSSMKMVGATDLMKVVGATGLALWALEWAWQMGRLVGIRVGAENFFGSIDRY